MSQQQLILGASTSEIQRGITLPVHAHIRPSREGEEPPPPYTPSAQNSSTGQNSGTGLAVPTVTITTTTEASGAGTGAAEAMRPYTATTARTSVAESRPATAMTVSTVQNDTPATASSLAP